MGTYPGMDPVARYYAMPGASPWPGDPSQDPGLTQPPSNGLFNQNLLGGNYTTQAALEANPIALANRRAGLQAGFVGGSGSEGWGDGNYRRYTEQQPTMPKPGYPPPQERSSPLMPLPSGPEYRGRRHGGDVRDFSPGDPGTPGQPYMPRPMPQPAFDQDLLGGRYSTQEALENNPAALAARRQGLERGFAGGDLWGDGNYRNYLAKMAKRGNPADDETSLHMQARNDQPMGGLMGNRGFGPGLLQQPGMGNEP